MLFLGFRILDRIGIYKLLSWALFVIIFLFFVFIITQIYLIRPANYLVNVQTQEFTLKQRNPNHNITWPEVQLVSTNRKLQGCQNPIFQSSSRINQELLSVEKDLTFSISPNGNLFIKIDSVDQKSVGEIKCSGGEWELSPSSVVIEWPSDNLRGISFGVAGQIVVGTSRVLRPEHQRLIKGGNIRVSVQSWPLDTGRTVEDVSIFPGDVITIYKNNISGPQAISFGVFEVKGRMIHLSFHSFAKVASVRRIGQHVSEVTSIAPTLWARIQAQAEWAVFALFTMICSNIALLIRGVYLERKMEIHLSRITSSLKNIEEDNSFRELINRESDKKMES